jgi:mannose-6-phosphate isomerase-like protein (cupin superfamily)
VEVIETGSVPEIKVEDRKLQWVVGEKGIVSSDCCSCCIVVFAPGSSAKPPHSHSDCEESIFLLSGSGEMVLKGGEMRSVKEGDYLLMRKNEIHMLKNTGQSPMKAICFYSAPTDNSKYNFFPMETVEIVSE